MLPKMRVVLQRVTRADVRVQGAVVGEIGPGLVALVGVGRGDDLSMVPKMADKIVSLRIFRDDAGKTNLDLVTVGGEVLVVSQFTLLADTRKGRRPSFVYAADPGEAAPIVESLAVALEERGVTVGRGVFGAEMTIDLVNDGPFTMVVDLEPGV
jgi:D-tyrosyl-tRNA(Tyr) deacylase